MPNNLLQDVVEHRQVQTSAIIVELIQGGDGHMFGKQFFQFPEAQLEPLVQPEGMAKDLRGKSINPVAGRGSFHAHNLPNPS